MAQQTNTVTCPAWCCRAISQYCFTSQVVVYFCRAISCKLTRTQAEKSKICNVSNVCQLAGKYCMVCVCFLDGRWRRVRIPHTWTQHGYMSSQTTNSVVLKRTKILPALVSDAGGDHTSAADIYFDSWQGWELHKSFPKKSQGGGAKSQGGKLTVFCCQLPAAVVRIWRLAGWPVPSSSHPEGTPAPVWWSKQLSHRSHVERLCGGGKILKSPKYYIVVYLRHITTLMKAECITRIFY